MIVNIEEIKETLGAMMTQQVSTALEDKKIQGREITFAAPVKLELRVINSDEEYIVTGKGKVELILPCSRCLEEVKKFLEFDFNYQIAKEEVQDDEIDLTEALWEHIRLALPMQIVCDEECQGLCPSCGVNLNDEDCDCIMHKVDPRLAKLEKLLDKDNS